MNNVPTVTREIKKAPFEPPRRILSPTGTVERGVPKIDSKVVLELFRQMLRTRAFDDRCMFLQRTGRLPAYYPCAGQEAHVAVPSVLEPADWIFSQYREQGVRLARGIPIQKELAVWRGKPFAAWDPLEFRITRFTSTIGTHLPHAVGYAYASELLGRKEISLAIFGDGATSEVDFHAALNAAGVWKTPTIFFCQNNQYAQSTPLAEQTAAPTLAQKANAYGIPGVRVDGMDVLAVREALLDAVERARKGLGPTLIESVCYRFSPHSTYDGVPVYRTREEEQQWREWDPLIRVRRWLETQGLVNDEWEATIRESTNSEVDAAIDQLDATELPARDQAFMAAFSRLPERVVAQLHEYQDEKAVARTEIAAERRFAAEEIPEVNGERRSMTFVEALNCELEYAMSSMGNRIVLGEDVGREGGIFRVTAGLYEKFGPRRVLDTPLCELTIAGSAVGMALAGARPICEIEFAGFTFTAFDQIAFHIARYAWRNQGKVRLPIVIRMPAGGGHGGSEGHSDSPEALFSHLPGALNVVYPSNALDAKGLLATALDSEDPVVFFEPVARYFVREDNIPIAHYAIPFGKAKTVRVGTDATIVTYGNGVHVAIEAAAILETEGLQVEILDLRTLKPWDEAAVLTSIQKTGRLVVVHEAPISSGFGAEIVATVVEKAGDWLETPPVRVAHADIPWGPSQLESQSIIPASRVAAAVRRVKEN